MSEIRPCPFCGREPESGAQNGCVRCPAHTGWLLAEQWDCRPVEDALRTERDEFRNGAAAQYALAFAAESERDRLRAEGQALDARNFHLTERLAAAEGQREALRAERDRLSMLIRAVRDAEHGGHGAAWAEAMQRLRDEGDAIVVRREP